MLLSQKIRGPVLVVHAISSLDDGIDFANQSAESSTSAASFLFAALPEANYLANFIDAHLSCVNHIPVELLGIPYTQTPIPNPTPRSNTLLTDHRKVGPIAPLHHTPSLMPRYTVAMFQEPRPQLLNNTTMTTLVGKTQHDPSYTGLTDLKQSLEAPLPPMDRKKGKDVDYFFQALLTGTTVVAVAVLISLGITARFALPYLRRRL